MCKYCEVKNGESVYLYDRSSCEVEIHQNNWDNKSSIDFYIESQDDSFSFEIEINFCPKCGRKLN